MLQWSQVLQLAKEGVAPLGPKVVKTPDQWRAQLSPDQFQVTRQAGTERPFSSEMCVHFEPGRYHCVCCNTLLFDASEKFDSGTGWPSFTQPAHPQAVAYKADHSHGMTRIEALCSTCDAHLGHVFPDGPEPSGLRYCMNALALQRAL